MMRGEPVRNVRLEKETQSLNLQFKKGEENDYIKSSA